MFEILAVLLFILWGIGLLTANTLGGFIHVLLLVAAIALLARFIRGRAVL